MATKYPVGWVYKTIAERKEWLKRSAAAKKGAITKQKELEAAKVGQPEPVEYRFDFDMAQSRDCCAHKEISFIDIYIKGNRVSKSELSKNTVEIANQFRKYVNARTIGARLVSHVSYASEIEKIAMMEEAGFVVAHRKVRGNHGMDLAFLVLSK